MADIFFSHSRADKGAADRIKAALERDRSSGSDFIDKHPRDGMAAGQGWQDRLPAESHSCRLVFKQITPPWLGSRRCCTAAVTTAFCGKDFVGVVPGDLADVARCASGIDFSNPVVLCFLHSER